MNGLGIQVAYDRLNDKVNDPKKIMILENGSTIVFHTLDFAGCGTRFETAQHVWLYMNDKPIACIDTRSVTGICVHPYPYK